MKKLIGYKFRCKIDNGDYNEWHRIAITESRIFSSKELALDSFYKFLSRKEQSILSGYLKDFRLSYLDIPEDEVEDAFNKSEYPDLASRDVEKTISKLRKKVRLVPVYVFDTQSSYIKEYSIAD